MKKISLFATLAILCSCSSVETETKLECPVAELGEVWELDPNFSDEFNADTINSKIWQTDVGGWGIRSWSKDCVTQKDGKLSLAMRYEEHQPKDEKYFYKMGIARSLQKTVYGYYEARIKGASLFPGVCPAFWLYSSGEQKVIDGDTITYSEIDIVELTMGEDKGTTVKTIDCNLHMRLVRDGQEVWQRPNTHPELCKTQMEATWDPRDDFHIYACENRPDSIIFYVDNKRIGAKKNYYWHLPMNLTFTMEPRKPHHRYTDKDGRAPVPEAATREGFPTSMEVDWVRVWKQKQ